MTRSSLTAASVSLLICPTCHQLNKTQCLPAKCKQYCSRCGTKLYFRKPNSLSRTWALTLTAIILYIPANILPIMSVISYGEGKPDTIISGIKHLIEARMYPVAILVFFASIIVPLLKLIVMIYLLISVQSKSHWYPRQRTIMYRILEVIGRWSMLDIFMIAILSSLVKIGAIATVEPGAGAIFFASVVVITIFATMSFDPRLIWDNIEKSR